MLFSMVLKPIWLVQQESQAMPFKNLLVDIPLELLAVDLFVGGSCILSEPEEN